MAEVDDERPPGEEDEETDPEPKLVTPVVQGSSVSIEQADLKAPTDAKDDVDANNNGTEGLIGNPSSESSALKSEDPASTPASAPQVAVSVAAEAAADPASVDPYAGYAGYDPAAAGYDYSAYWAQYGYHSGYNHSGYYPGYEGYYDPAVYQGYAAQPTATVPPPQPPTGPPPETVQPSATQPEAAPGAETEEKEEIKDNEETVQRSTAEEEERKRAEEERVRAAQAAAEEATRAAAEESARQAAEQQRLADEAAVRAQNLAMQRANVQQAQMGPSPEVLARIQKELAEAQAQAAKKKAEQEEAAVAAIRAAAAAEATAAAGAAAAKKPAPPKNIFLKGARMAFQSSTPTVKSPPAIQGSVEPPNIAPQYLPPAKSLDKPKDKAGKLYMPEPFAKANRQAIQRVSPSPQSRRSRSQSQLSRSSCRSMYASRSRSRSFTPNRRGRERRRSYASRSVHRSRSFSRSSMSVSRSPSRSPARSFSPAPARQGAKNFSRQYSPSPDRGWARSRDRQYTGMRAFPPQHIKQERYEPSPVTQLHASRSTESTGLQRRIVQEPDPAKARKKEKKKRKRRHKDRLTSQSPEAGSAGQNQKHRRKKRRQPQLDYDEQDNIDIAETRGEAIPMRQNAPRESAAVLTPVEVAPPSSVVKAKPFSIPSPPRISDLRRKYGITISAAGHSPSYSSTPSPSPPPARTPKATQPAANLRPALGSAADPQSAPAPVIESRRPPAATRESLFPVLTSPAVAAIKEEAVPVKSSVAAQIPERPVLKLAQPPGPQQNAQIRPGAKIAAPIAPLQLKLPAQVKEAAAALASKAQKQEAIEKKGQFALQDRVSDQPVISGPASKTNSQAASKVDEKDAEGRKAPMLRRPVASPPPRARSPVAVRGQKRYRASNRRSYSRDSRSSSPRRRSRSRSSSRSPSRGRSRRRPRSRRRSYSRSRSSGSPYSRSRSRSRSYSSSRYSSRSRSRSRRRSRLRGTVSSSRSRSRSRSITPARIIRARSPVIPKRMRMDEERPGNDVMRATQAARRAASKVTAEATRKLEPIAKPVTLPPPSLPVETDGNQSTSTQVQSGLASIKDPPEPTESKEAGQKPKSRVLRLANMLGREDLVEDEDYDENLEDITQEVEKKYGKLRGIEIPRPRKTGVDPPGVGLVFLAFENEKGAQKAQLALNGRKFGENTIQSSFFEEGLFVRKQWT